MSIFINLSALGTSLGGWGHSLGGYSQLRALSPNSSEMAWNFQTPFYRMDTDSLRMVYVNFHKSICLRDFSGTATLIRGRVAAVHENLPPIGGIPRFLTFEKLGAFISSRALKWHKPGVSSFIR